MTHLMLDLIKIHNDERVHPQRPSMRVFRQSEGFRIYWYPPNLFCIEVDYDEGARKNTAQRWFATTNVETWIVAGDAAKARAEVEQCLGTETAPRQKNGRLCEQPKG